MSSIVPRAPGIYKITCTTNGKFYIGSSINLYKREKQHRYELTQNTHINHYLQNAWNKYGEESFTFEVVEFVFEWSLLDREQYWLDKLKPYKRGVGFNIARCAEAPNRGQVASPEMRAKVSAAHKGKRLSPEHRAKIGATSKGRKHSAESRAKASASNKNPSLAIRERIAQKLSLDYLIISPDGDEYRVKGLAKFCREHGLHTSDMCAVAKGKWSHHKGWKCQKIDVGH
jgi:group I intron endonuclease